MDHIQTVNQIKENKEFQKPLHVAFVDYEAFDSVKHKPQKSRNTTQVQHSSQQHVHELDFNRNTSQKQQANKDNKRCQTKGHDISQIVKRLPRRHFQRPPLGEQRD